MATKSAPKKKISVDKRELERWKEKGKALAVELRSAEAKFSGRQWAIADWMLAGEKAFKEKVAYAEASKVTGMTEETLRQFAHTARRVLTRVNGLSFGHHRLVAKFWREPREQKRLLQDALKNKMSVEQFASYINGEQEPEPTSAEDAAVRVIDSCKKVLRPSHLYALLNGELPARDVRDELISKLTDGAKQLTEAVEDLKEYWGRFFLHHRASIPPSLLTPALVRYRDAMRAAELAKAKDSALAAGAAR